MTWSARDTAFENGRDPAGHVHDATSGWNAGICPICLFLARVCPDPGDGARVACDRCGAFDIAGAARDVLASHAGPLDRRRLSEAARDACMMAECGRPLIDQVTASVLIGLVDLDS